MSKYCLFLIVIYYLTGGNNSMSRFCKFGKLHVTKGNVDKLLGILLTASKELKRSLA
ncbi:TPA: rRNA adenine methyltransferase, partial [Clostridioides difficile]|nr:rRNA adenine methyltransferase [Enterococcus faecalis]EHU4989863.1 rRNA adenine methyltransferase [Enterococcus faecalis]HBH3071490.1 rRNA adenine methyltransferase [Clostridioides difficile]HEM4389300.1 rRNA adenine methyltransferase [Streptococcus suis]HEV9511032.1 rRNA adenine methyltransferase [Streptococcus pneumoniae]